MFHFFFFLSPELPTVEYLSVSGCDIVEDMLPYMMFTMIGIYGVVALVCVLAWLIAWLVYRTERRRKLLEVRGLFTFS